MNVTVETPTAIRELTRYVECEHPRFRTLLSDQHEQLVVVGQPGQPELPAALREILGGACFERTTWRVEAGGSVPSPPQRAIRAARRRPPSSPHDDRSGRLRHAPRRVGDLPQSL